MRSGCQHQVAYVLNFDAYRGVYITHVFPIMAAERKSETGLVTSIPAEHLAF